MPQLPGSSGAKPAARNAASLAGAAKSSGTSQASSRAGASGGARSQKGQAKIKILLADDSVTMHRAVTLGLKNEPFEVITCDNGQDALRLALEHFPRIVLADLDMPGLTGVELCQAIRAESTLRETRVVLLCGSFDQIDEARLNSVQADGRLWKPFESHALVALIQTLLKAPPARGPASEPTLAGGPHVPAGSGNDATAAGVGNDFDDTSPDLARDMTRETFREATQPGRVMESPELPQAKAQSRKAAAAKPQPKPEPQPEPAQESPSVGDSLNDDQISAMVSEDLATSNLWSLDYEPDPLASPESSNAPLEPGLLEEPSQDFQIVTNSLEMSDNELPSAPDDFSNDATSPLPLDEAIDFEEPQVERIGGVSQEDLHSPATPTATGPNLASGQVDAWAEDADFSSFREGSEKTSTRGRGLPPPPKASSLSEAEIRMIIREEIADAFQGWLQKKLQEKLAQVMAEIDRE